MDWMEIVSQVYSWFAVSHEEAPIAATGVKGENSHYSMLV
jgi:hypothetical protein